MLVTRSLVPAFSALCTLLLLSPVQTQNQPAPAGLPLARLNVIVIDGAGHSVDNVRKEDLQLFDDGNPETIAEFSKEERSVSYGLVIDCSGSLKLQFQKILEAAKQMITTNKADDETFIITFVASNNVQTFRELTSDKNVLTSGLSTLKPGMGQTALIDALYLATEYSIKHESAAGNRRRALVLISDGEDRSSYYKEDALFSLLAKSNLQVFILGLVEALDDQRGFVRESPQQKAVQFLTKLGEQTGGRTFFLDSEKDLPNAITEIAHDVHTQFVLGYQPTKNPEKVKRKVQIKVVASPEHKKWKVIGRRVIEVKR